jgi:hypothetical protein
MLVQLAPNTSIQTVLRVQSTAVRESKQLGPTQVRHLQATTSAFQAAVVPPHQQQVRKPEKKLDKEFVKGQAFVDPHDSTQIFVPHQATPGAAVLAATTRTASGTGTGSIHNSAPPSSSNATSTTSFSPTIASPPAQRHQTTNYIQLSQDDANELPRQPQTEATNPYAS